MRRTILVALVLSRACADLRGTDAADATLRARVEEVLSARLCGSHTSADGPYNPVAELTQLADEPTIRRVLRDIVEQARLPQSRNSRRPNYDYTAMLMLGNLKDRESLDLLGGVLLDPGASLSNRTRAADVLVMIDARASQHFLLRALEARPSDELLRGKLALALAGAPDRASREAIEKALATETSAYARRKMTDALSQLNGAAAR